MTRPSASARRPDAANAQERSCPGRTSPIAARVIPRRAERPDSERFPSSPFRCAWRAGRGGGTLLGTISPPAEGPMVDHPGRPRGRASAAQLVLAAAVVLVCVGVVVVAVLRSGGGEPPPVAEQS